MADQELQKEVSEFIVTTLKQLKEWKPDLHPKEYEMAVSVYKKLQTEDMVNEANWRTGMSRHNPGELTIDMKRELAQKSLADLKITDAEREQLLHMLKMADLGIEEWQLLFGAVVLEANDENKIRRFKSFIDQSALKHKTRNMK